MEKQSRVRLTVGFAAQGFRASRVFAHKCVGVVYLVVTPTATVA